MMTDPNPAKTIVTAALTIVVVFGGLLGARALVRWANASAPEPPPPVVVAAPTSGAAAGLEVPCWSCPSAKSWPVQFRTDLDLIAPVGGGNGNAAEFFAAFEKHRGPREADARALMDRRVERKDDFGKVVAGDDPLLLEAEPWADQAVMRFYPEIFPLEGVDTRITNLLFMLTLARSWAARGVDAADPDVGLEDCRRAIRLGRLLRQEDVTVINDLVGLACVHLGSRGVYRIAQREGRSDLALLASVILGEVAPQRMMTAQKISALDLEPYIRPDGSGEIRLDLPDGHLETIATMSETLTERRFFGEIILPCHVIVRLGTPEQQRTAQGILRELAAGDDTITADFAQWALNNPATDEVVAGYYPHPMER